MMKLNANQIQAVARENIQTAAKRVAKCFDLASAYNDFGMTKDAEYLINVEVVTVILEGFISSGCYPTFDSEFDVELEKLGYEIIFGAEGCGYITNHDNEFCIYFG